MPEAAPSNTDDAASIVLFVPARLKRIGVETRLLIEGTDNGARRKPDHSFYRVLVQAQQYRAMVMQGDGKSTSALAAEAGIGSSYFSHILRLGFLCPDIVTPSCATAIRWTCARSAFNEVRIPVNWEEQRTLLGIE